MLHLITGVPGAKKTAFTVSMLYDIENDNKVNIVKNKSIYNHNKQIIEKNDLKKHFSYLLDEVGSGDELKQVITPLDDDYFDFFAIDYDDLRPDDYFKKSVEYNKIVERITDNLGDFGLQSFLPVRTIYTNINNLKIDYVRANKYDWRDCPDGSIIVIDEVQLVEPYKETKNKDNPVVQDLTIHRHRGFDFYFITQSAALLHVQIKDLIAVHYHLTLPYGWVTKVYQYGSFRANPNAVSVKLAAERSFSFKPDPKIFKLYKSTTINTAKKRIPYKVLLIMVAFALFGIIGFTIAVYKVKNSKSYKSAQNGFATSSTAVTSAPGFTALASSTAVTSAPAATVLVEQQKQKIEQKYLTLYDMEVADNDNIRPAAIVMRGRYCRAINRFGDNLDVSQDLCKLMLKDNSLIPHARQIQQVNATMPVQPMSQQKPVQNVAPVSSPAPLSAPAPIVQHSIIKT